MSRGVRKHLVEEEENLEPPEVYGGLGNGSLERSEKVGVSERRGTYDTKFPCSERTPEDRNRSGKFNR